MARENMMCAAHKAGNEKYRDGWNYTFGGQNPADSGKKEMRHCRFCGEKYGEMVEIEWVKAYNQRCDECDEKLKKGEYINPNGN